MDRERVALPGVEDELILADEARRSVSGDDEDRVVDLLRRPAGGREANAPPSSPETHNLTLSVAGRRRTTFFYSLSLSLSLSLFNL